MSLSSHVEELKKKHQTLSEQVEDAFSAPRVRAMPRSPS